MQPEPVLQFEYIDNDTSMKRLVSALKNNDVIALDIEADSLHHFYEKVCLMQITFDESNFIVDPLAEMDISALLEELKHKTLIFHDAGYDLRMMQSSFRFEPKGDLFDTMLAGQLLGFQYLGLAAMLERFFGITVSKVGQKWDWSARPLEKEKLEYAVCDTHYLPELMRILDGKLRELGRENWHRESCKRCVETAMKEKRVVEPDKEWRIKGTRQLDGLTLTILKNIWYWRQKQAKEADLPPYKIMGNGLMLSIAEFCAKNPNKALKKGVKLPKHCIGQRLWKLKHTIKDALNTPESEWMHHPKSKYGKRPSLISQRIAEELKEKCTTIAEKLELAPQIIAPKAALNLIANNRPESVEGIMECSGLMNWQANLLAEAVEKTLDKYPDNKNNRYK